MKRATDGAVLAADIYMRLQEDPYPDLPPRDAPVLEPLGPAPPEVYRQVYGGMARANANEAVKVMELEPGFYWMGSPDDAAWYARFSYWCCVIYKSAGGKTCH